MKFVSIIVFIVVSQVLLVEILAWEKNIFEPTRLECIRNPERISNCTGLIKHESRNKKVISFQVDLVKPINAAFLTVQLYKRFNGWQPYMVNFTSNFCEFMKSGKANYVVKLMAPIFFEHSNVNHSCPYNHTLIWHDIDFNTINFPAIKNSILPGGYYKIQLILRESKDEWLYTTIFR